MINIHQLSKLTSNLTIFLFIIAGNYVGDIYSCKLRKLFKNSMISKHIIGYFLLLFFVGIFQEEFDMKQKLLISGGLYASFILIMRSPYYITLFSGFAIAIMYLINLYITDLQKIGDQVNVDIYSKINNRIFFLVITSSIVGVLLHINDKKKKYKNKFSIYYYLLGSRDQECFANE